MSRKEQAALGRQNILSFLCGLKNESKISSRKRSRSPSSAAVSEVQTKTDTKRRNVNILDTNVNQSTFDHLTWPRFSLREDGIIAQLSIPESQRVPLLISDIRVLLNQFLMPKFSDKSAKCWYKLTASKNAPQMTLLILDGVSTDTFRDLYRCHEPTKINMYYKRMLKEGRITSYAGDYERKTNLQNKICKNDLEIVEKSEVQSDKIKKDSQLVCKATKDVSGTDKKKVFNSNNGEDNMDTNHSISDTVNTPSNLQSFLCTWLPQTSSVLNNCVEMVAPSIYGHTIIQDLLVVRVPGARRLLFRNGRKKRNAPYKPIATMEKRKPEIVLYNHATGNTQHSVQQPTSISFKQEERGCDESSGTDEKYCLNFPFYNDLKKQNCKSLDTIDKRWIWNQDLKSRSIKFYKQDKFDRRKLLMSLDQMVKMKCPVLPELLVKFNIASAFQLGSSKLICTKSIYTHVAASSPMFGIDCEFYKDRSPLRIAIVNECGTVVYDKYISRLDHKKISHSAVTLEEVQSEIIDQLPPNAILVGHSIGHDLTALQMHHPFLIDTSLHYDIGDKTQRLRTLARHFLDKEIQFEKTRHHDPREDARCALELVQLKLKTSISFGNRKLGGYIPDLHKQKDLSTTEDLVDYYNMFEMLEEQISNFSTTEYFFRTKVCLMSTAKHIDLWNYSLQSVSFPLQRCKVSDNKQLWNTVCSETPDCDLIIAHFQENPRLHSNKAKVRLNALAKLDKLITSAYNSVPDKSLFAVMFTGSGLDAFPQDKSNGVFMIGKKGNLKIPTDP